MRRLFYFMLICLLTLIPHASRAADNPAYTIDNIKVDVTDKDAITAQGKAFVTAQEQAFQALAQRLLTPDALSRLKTPDDQTLSTMLRDYEITAEQRSTVRYIGTYSIRFKPDAVRAYIATQSLSVNNYTPPVLLLPVYQRDGRAMLWSADNPWRAAWTHSSSAGAPVLPTGDTGDAAMVNDRNVMSITAAQLQPLEKRYHTTDAVIAVAIPGPEDANAGLTGADAQTVSVELYRTDRGAPLLARRLTITGQAGEDENALLSRAAQTTKNALQHNWKGRIPSPSPFTEVEQAQSAPPDGNAENSDQSAPAPGAVSDSKTVTIAAHFAGVQEWLGMQKTIRKISGVRDLMTLSLQPTMAQLSFHYAGDTAALRSALQAGHLTLMPGDPQGATYSLYRSGGAPNVDE